MGQTGSKTNEKNQMWPAKNHLVTEKKQINATPINSDKKDGPSLNKKNNSSYINETVQKPSDTVYISSYDNDHITTSAVSRLVTNSNEPNEITNEYDEETVKRLIDNEIKNETLTETVAHNENNEVIQIDEKTRMQVIDVDKNVLGIEQVFYFNEYSTHDHNQWIKAINNARWDDYSMEKLQKQQKWCETNKNESLLFHTEQLILHKACCVQCDSDQNEQNDKLLTNIFTHWQHKNQIDKFRQKIISSTCKCIENDNDIILRCILTNCYRNLKSTSINDQWICFINHAAKTNAFDCIQLLLEDPSVLNWRSNFKNPIVLYDAIKYTQNKDLINFVLQKLESLKISFICDEIMKQVIVKDLIEIAKRLVNNGWHHITARDEELAESLQLRINTYFKQRSSVSAFHNDNNPTVFTLDLDDWESEQGTDDDWDQQETNDNLQEDWIKTLKVGYKLDAYNGKQWLIASVLDISDNGDNIKLQYDVSRRIEEISLYCGKIKELHSETVSHNYIISHSEKYFNCGPICNASNCETVCSKCKLQICGLCLGVAVDCNVLCKDCFMKYEYKYLYDLAKVVLQPICQDTVMERNIGIMIVKFMAQYICNKCRKQIDIIPQFSRGIIIEMNEELVDLNYLKNYKAPQVSCGYICTL